MANEPLRNRDLQCVWQKQTPEEIRMSVDEIRLRARKLEKKIYWRNAREYIAAVAVVVFFGFELARTHDLLMGTGFGLIIAGMLYLMWQLHRQGSSRGMAAEMGLESGVDFFRRELERQRNLLQHVWRWYLAPLVPGLVVVTVAVGRKNPHHLHHYGWFLVAYSLLVALGFIFVWRLNERAARRLQRHIDELDALRDAS
jgi:Flp pilus assembly protein TadB